MNTAILETRSSISLAGQGMLVVLDGAVPHRQGLRRGLLPGAQVLELVPGGDGLAQITAYLAAHGGFNSLHVVSHGEPGQLFLADQVVDLETLRGNRLALESWRGAGGDRFEILLYGCNVGQGAAGSQFIETLAAFTGATVAASPTPTGHESLGGRWQLTTQTAPLTASLAFTPATQASYPAILVKYTINPGGGVVADDPSKSFTAGNVESALIQAIINANANPGPDTIELASGTEFSFTTFNINAPNEGASALPLITDPGGLTITGLTSGGNLLTRNAPNDNNLINNFRFFTIRDGARLTLDNLILEKGRVVGGPPFGNDGGAILNSGTLEIKNSTLRNNFAADDGGAIANVGVDTGAKLTITNSILIGNVADGDDNPTTLPTDDGGGAIETDGGGASATTFAIINNSTITGNTANGGTGGGIRARNGGALTINDSDITNNTAGAGGGISLLRITPPRLETETITLAINGSSPGATQINNNTVTVLTGQNFEDVAEAIVVGGVPTPPSVGGPRAIALDSNTVNEIRNGRVIIGIPPLDPSETTNIPELQNTIPNEARIILELLGPAGDALVVDQTTASLQFNPGDPRTKTFRITNTGGSALGVNTFAIANDPDSNFTIDTTGTAATLNAFTTGGTPAFTTFNVTFNGSADVTTPAAITFAIDGNTATPAPDGTVINDVGTDNSFTFGLTAAVATSPPPPPPPPPGVSVSPLQIDRETSLFTAGAGVGGRVKVSVLNAPAATTKSALQSLKVTYVSGGNLTEELFSVLPVIGQPDGFGIGLQSFLLDRVDDTPFVGNETFRIELANSNIASRINVNAGGNGVHDVIFDTNSDGQFNSQDLTLRINQTNEAIPLGVGTVQANGLELIDLRSATGGRVASFTLFREATFNNTVGLYRIDDISGAVNGIAPGQAGYAQAAISNRISEVTLNVGNQQSRTVTSTLQGGALYAPFMVVNAGIDDFLNSNPNNAGGGINAFFAYQAANPDVQNHIVLLGNNTFGFEDLFGGGDRDFNDMIFQVQIT